MVLRRQSPLTINTVFFLPVPSANPPHNGADIMVTIGRIACSVPMRSGSRPTCFMYSVMKGLGMPVEKRNRK